MADSVQLILNMAVGSLSFVGDNLLTIVLMGFMVFLLYRAYVLLRSCKKEVLEEESAELVLNNRATGKG